MKANIVTNIPGPRSLELKEKRENLTKRIAMNEKIDDIHLRASALYKIKSFLLVFLTT